MLIRVLRNHLRPYRRLLLLIVGLQIVAVSASLTLPALNADIIDKGVLTGDTAYIRSTGAEMLAFSRDPDRLRRRRRVLRRQGGDELRPRPARSALPPRHRLLGPGGGPVRRPVAHHPDHQRRAAGADARGDGVHDGGRRADHHRHRRGDGPARRRRPVDRAGDLHAGRGRRARHRSSSGWSRTSAGCKTTSTPSTASCGSRSPASGWSGPSPGSPQETERFRHANDDVTDAGMRGGRLMASMFPTVNLLINISSVAVLWIGADRVASGDLEIGSLVAYLSYLIQILMSVVMATFTLSMVPEGGRLRRTGSRRCSTPSAPWRRRRSAVDAPRRGVLEVRDVGFNYPGAERPVLCDISFDATAGTRHRHHRQHRCRQDEPGEPARPALRPDHRDGAPRRRRPARPGSRPAVVEHRPGAPEAVPLLGHGGEQPPVRQARRHRGRHVGGPHGRPGRRLRARHARRPRGAHRAGRHQRVGWAAPTPLDRPGARAQARALRLRRLVLGARPGHRCPPARRPRPLHPRCRGGDRRPARVHHRHRRRDPRARGRRAGRPRHPRGAARQLPDVCRDRAEPDR